MIASRSAMVRAATRRSASYASSSVSAVSSKPASRNRPATPSTRRSSTGMPARITRPDGTSALDLCATRPGRRHCIAGAHGDSVRWKWTGLRRTHSHAPSRSSAWAHPFSPPPSPPFRTVATDPSSRWPGLRRESRTAEVPWSCTSTSPTTEGAPPLWRPFSSFHRAVQRCRVGDSVRQVVSRGWLRFCASASSSVFRRLVIRSLRRCYLVRVNRSTFVSI
jgi:hypothetical protein